jgi:4-hydroxythreonine-4-phosphate dehydrogenase
MKQKEKRYAQTGATPVLGITMGDPAGIGPEIAAKALAQKQVYDISRPLIIGDSRVMEKALSMTGLGLEVRSVLETERAIFRHGTLDVIDACHLDVGCLENGKISALAGKSAYETIEFAIDLALAGKIDAMVTGPVHKKAVNTAGYEFSGHTEMLAKASRTKQTVMLLVDGDLRVGHVSTHVPLREACSLVKKERVFTVIRLVHEACIRLGIIRPKIAVAGLNPHAGDNGLFGSEEEKEISPAIEKAQGLGMFAEGPLSPDTVFAKARGGAFDAVIAMYHDQGHIPLKMLGFTWDPQEGKWETVRGVNITLGLPFVRTSVDHGTAFEIAGQGIASPESMISAIEMAVRLTSKA